MNAFEFVMQRLELAADIYEFEGDRERAEEQRKFIAECRRERRLRREARSLREITEGLPRAAKK